MCNVYMGSSSWASQCTTAPDELPSQGHKPLQPAPVECGRAVTQCQDLPGSLSFSPTSRHEPPCRGTSFRPLLSSLFVFVSHYPQFMTTGGGQNGYRPAKRATLHCCFTKASQSLCLKMWKLESSQLCCLPFSLISHSCRSLLCNRVVCGRDILCFPQTGFKYSADTSTLCVLTIWCWNAAALF